MLVEFECGCIGVVHEDDDCSHLVIRDCTTQVDRLGSPFGIGNSVAVQDKTYRKMDSLEILELFKALAPVVRDGNALRSLRMAFDMAGLR
jgi:hypothetical protein